MTNDAEFKPKLQTHKVYNQEWVGIFCEGLWNYSSRFLWIMSWGALIALLIQYKCGHTNYIKHVYECEQCIKRKSWEIEDQIQTRGYVSRFEPLLYVPAFT